MIKAKIRILGIETSCDETSASVIEDGHTLLSNIILSSMDKHAIYGGVVPEIAARSHIEAIIPVVNQAINEADCDWQDIDAIAVTNGAGLGGSLLIGVLTARTLSITQNKPLYAINHVMGHVYANFLTNSSSRLSDYVLPIAAPVFPCLALIVSGGHSQLVFFRDHFNYQVLGKTQDDAVGEAFDKVAKILGLPYPGGPSVAQKALQGNSQQYKLPDAKVGKYDFSFSGLKTAVLRLAQQEIAENYDFPSIKLSERLSEAQKADIAASFQYRAVETLVSKTLLAFLEFKPKSVVIAGGVAANMELRQQLTARIPIKINYTDPKLCTDNGAMIATLGYYSHLLGINVADPYTIDIVPNLTM